MGECIYISEQFLREKNYIKKPIQEYQNSVLSAISSPKISVLIITYNHADYISDALDSILKQKTSFEFEIILGDDQSTDGTREICIEYAKRFPDKIRLFLHFRENNIKVLGKPCGIFQYIYNMLQARGSYIAISSGDDVWTDPAKLQRQLDYLENNPKCSIVYQRWQEKLNKPNGSWEFGPTLKKFPKASTAVYVNINGRLPLQMLNVIQEDAFTWFILKEEGTFDCIDELEPVIVNTPIESLSRSLSMMALVKQRLNLKRAIFKAFKGTERDREAKRQYTALLTDIYVKSKYRNVKYSAFAMVFIQVIKDGLLPYLIGRVISRKSP